MDLEGVSTIVEISTEDISTKAECKVLASTNTMKLKNGCLHISKITTSLKSLRRECSMLNSKHLHLIFRD
jgi:predicted protein tyrosine phosphatase